MITVTVTAVVVTALASALASAAQVSAEMPPVSERTSRVLRAELPAAARSASPADAPELGTAGRKFGTDDGYRTLSSVTSDLVVEASAAATGPKAYPSLTTGPPAAGLVTRGRYIRNPFGNFGKDDQETEFEDDPHANEFLFNGGGMPKWNRYNTNHRQLNKFIPAAVESDITVDEDGSAGYGSTFELGSGGGGGGGGVDVGGSGVGYDSGYYRNPGAVIGYDSGYYRNPGGGTGYDSGNYKGPGGGMGYDSGAYRSPGNGWVVGGDGGGGIMGWYSEPIAQATRPLPIIAEIRHPSTGGGSSGGGGHKMSVDITKIGMLAMIKIAVAKLKALGFIKAVLLVTFKLKLLLLLVAMKFLMIAKFTKFIMFLPALMSFFTVPMLFSRLSRLHSLVNQPVLVPNNFGGGNGGGNGNNNPNTGGMNTTPTTDTGGNTNTQEESVKRTRRLNSSEALVPRMTNIGQIIRSEKCLERVSCRMAGAKKPSLALIWLNWIAAPLSNYIPSKKLKIFVSTFTEVTNYRLDNLYSNLLPKDWTKWCNDHYTCKESTHKSL